MRITLLATGGTIASHRSEEGFLVVGLDGATLLSRVQLPAGATVEPLEFSAKPSFNLSTDDMLALVRKVRELLDAGSTGVVLTHGTDTLEETAFLLAQYFPRDARIVLTGAQRGADEPDSDGPRNLSDALRVVSNPVSLGPCVVAGGVVVAAAEAQKVHTSSLRAFAATESGPLALVDDDGVHLRAAARRGGHCHQWPLPPTLPRVDLVKLVAGCDGVHIDASVAAGAAGVVVESFGAGNATPAVVTAVTAAIEQGVTVVVTSRAGHGRVRSIYGNSGGGAELARAGAIFASDLTGVQARTALMILLAADQPNDIAAGMAAIAEGTCP